MASDKNRLWRTTGLSLVFITIAGWLNLNFFKTLESPYLFVDIDQPQGCLLKAYWDTGNGFQESATELLKFGRYERQVLRFKIPKGLKTLRLDPDLPNQELRIREMRLGWFRWPFQHRIHADQIEALHELMLESPANGNGLKLTLTPQASDPHFLVLKDAPEWQQTWDAKPSLKMAAMALTLIPLIATMLLIHFSKDPS
jgi:hypothetical protein